MFYFPELVLAPLLGAILARLMVGFGERLALAERLAKWAVYYGLTLLLVFTVGRPWSLVWAFGVYGLILVVHVPWCLRHGIHPLTAEPKDRYYRLRGWTEPEKG